MSNYAHVANPLLRIILEDGIGFEDYMRTALRITADCFHTDLDDESIPYRVMEARRNALGDAERCFYAEMYNSCLHHLRRYWEN